MDGDISNKKCLITLDNQSRKIKLCRINEGDVLLIKLKIFVIQKSNIESSGILTGSFLVTNMNRIIDINQIKNSVVCNFDIERIEYNIRNNSNDIILELKGNNNEIIWTLYTKIYNS
jgi:hypothetical protein